VISHLEIDGIFGILSVPLKDFACQKGDVDPPVTLPYEYLSVESVQRRKKSAMLRKKTDRTFS